jgi:eukaryotic-like serine/threonine-protein kinase
MTLSAGARLGPYEILAPIGAGGMGEVYKAQDTRLGREVAIKVLPESLAENAEALSRFQREARAVAALSHPNILAIHDFGKEGETSYAVMELLQGESLRERLSSGALPVRKAVEIAIQIARGLAAAHEKGIVHRDLKPENLFATGDGHVKILDFGLATHVSIVDAEGTNSPTIARGTDPGTVLGTVGYMSPEQVRGKPADQRSDIFSFGCVLYEMLSGRRAFHGDSAAETMAAIAQKEPPELSESGLNIPPGLDRLVRHCLEKRPEDRFQSARDLAFDLEASAGASSSSSGRAGTIAGTAGRRPRRFAAAAILLLLLALPLAYRAGTHARSGSPPTFRPFTYRRGTIRAARFSPDGHTIVYGAAWQGEPIRLFSAGVENLESAPIALPGADIFAINPSGEMLISLGRHYLTTHHNVGTLAIAPLSGGAAREVLENVQAADFGPDGKTIAVIRDVEGKNRVEYPVGKVLCETVGWMSHLRVSPRGDYVAFFDHPSRWDNRGTLAVVDLRGRKKTLTQMFNSEEGLTWSPSGEEIWFSAGAGLSGDSVRAVTPDGRLRVVYSGLGDLAIFDVSRDGRVLVSRTINQREMMFGQSGETREHDLSWLDWSYPIDLRRDGRAVLFTESGMGAGPNYGVFLRLTNGSPAVRIGEGNAYSLSPDGKFALSSLLTNPGQLILLPAGAGEPKPLALAPIELHLARWFPAGDRILLEGHQPGQGARLYIANPGGGVPRPVSGEGARLNGSNPISPDGRFVTTTGRDGKSYVQPLDGGEPRPIAGLSEDDEISRWTPDGSALYVFRHGELPAKVVLLNLATGQRQPWREVLPSDPSGVVTITPILFTPDGKTYAYSYPRILSQLFLADGLK